MDNIKWGQRFHFESRWAETEDYLNLIKSRWVNSDIPNRIQQVLAFHEKQRQAKQFLASFDFCVVAFFVEILHPF
ncbi:hypothetical protein ACOSQ2_010021 [Xanthoceras sorbifolium]